MSERATFTSAELVSSPLASSPVASSSEAAIHTPASKRARTCSSTSTEKPLRLFKWGRCQECSLALSPYIMASGRYRGRLTLMCNGFWKKPDSATNTSDRRCWWHSLKANQDFPMHRWGELPQCLKEQYGDIRTGLLRTVAERGTSAVCVKYMPFLRCHSCYHVFALSSMSPFFLAQGFKVSGHEGILEEWTTCVLPELS